MRKLTIGMATYDDFDGLYFTIQSIRMYHKEVLDDIEFIIIDNNPNSAHGKSNKDFTTWIDQPVQYMPFNAYNATIVKNKVFELAETPYVLCIDCHVLLEPGSIKKLIEFYDSKQDGGNLIQGPLVYDDFKNVSTHFDLNWSSYMWGQWGTDERGVIATNEPFEIPAQGCGLISCRRDSWLGFNKLFRGFGGEEGYIHHKYKKHGKKTLCVPFLRWMHRFERPEGVKYPNDLGARFTNYMIGFKELDIDNSELKDHFREALSEETIKQIEAKVADMF